MKTNTKIEGKINDKEELKNKDDLKNEDDNQKLEGNSPLMFHYWLSVILNHFSLIFLYQIFLFDCFF